MKVLIDFSPTYYSKVLDEYQHLLEKIAKFTLNYLNIDMPEILMDVSFVSKEKIKKINSEYRNKDYATDVISFALWDSGIKTPLLGELFICIPIVKIQAKKYNHSFKRELSFLFLHGLLHLLGYDHQNENDEKIMFNLQDEILNQLKIMR